MQNKPETVDKVRKSLKEITKKLEHKKTTYKPQTIKEQQDSNNQQNQYILHFHEQYLLLMNMMMII